MNLLTIIFIWLAVTAFMSVVFSFSILESTLMSIVIILVLQYLPRKKV